MRRVRFELCVDRSTAISTQVRLFRLFLLIPCWESQRLIPKRSAGPRATKIGVVSLKALDHLSHQRTQKIPLVMSPDEAKHCIAVVPKAPDDVRGGRQSALLYARGWRTFAPYLRGFGPTRFLSAGTIRDGHGVTLAQDAIDLADALKLDTFAVGGLVASWPATDIKKIFICRSGRQHWPFLQSNPQEDDMLRDVMEGNAAHIEPPAVFALHARRQLGRHRRGHSFVHADQTSMARGGACRADRQPAQPGAAELRHPRRRRCRPASPLPEARAELPRDACDEVAPSSSNRDECAACATTPGIRQGSRWSIDTPG